MGKLVKGIDGNPGATTLESARNYDVPAGGPGSSGKSKKSKGSKGKKSKGGY
jgi:hypothetical protein